LDIDGVLNSPDDWVAATYMPDEINPTNATTFMMNRTKVALLKFLVKTTYAEIVITSTWRLHDDDRVVQKLEDCGWEDAADHIIDNTPEIPSRNRDEEVAEWLYNNCPSTSRFVILDDIAPVHWNIGFQRHLVHVDNEVGLTMREVKQAVRILNGELNEI
jgi:hypothetical protein